MTTQRRDARRIRRALLIALIHLPAATFGAPNMQTVIDILVVLAVLYILIDAIRAFTGAAGNVWQKLWAAGHIPAGD